VKGGKERGKGREREREGEWKGNGRGKEGEENHFSEFYPQDGCESQLALKLRHCHPMYITNDAYFIYVFI